MQNSLHKIVKSSSRCRKAYETSVVRFVCDIVSEAVGWDRLCGTAASKGPFVQAPDDKCVNMEQQWYDIDRGKPKDSEKSLYECHFVHRKPGKTWPGQEPGFPLWRLWRTAWGMRLPRRACASADLLHRNATTSISGVGNRMSAGTLSSECPREFYSIHKEFLNF
jgi:hypothetical protein